MITFSGLHRVKACPPSAILPHSEKANDAATNQGVEVHRFLELLSTGISREAALELCTSEHRRFLSVIEVDKLPATAAGQYAAEVAFAYNWRNGTARELGRGTGRDYSDVGPDEIPGTADVVGLTPDAVVVLDYKAGPYANRRGAVGESMQLRGYALAAARAYGKERAIIGEIRIGADGAPAFETAEVTAEMLATDEAALRSDMLAVQSLIDGRAELPTVEGPHCAYCPAFASCPAKSALARALGGDGTSLALGELTPETALKARERSKAAKQVLKQVDEALDLYFRANPVTLPSGKVLGEKAERTPNMRLALPILRDLHGAEVAKAAIKAEPKMTWASIKDALHALWESRKAKGEKVTFAEIERETRRQLEDRGACDVKMVVDEFDPKRLGGGK